MRDARRWRDASRRRPRRGATAQPWLRRRHRRRTWRPTRTCWRRSRSTRWPAAAARTRRRRGRPRGRRRRRSATSSDRRVAATHRDGPAPPRSIWCCQLAVSSKPAALRDNGRQRTLVITKPVTESANTYYADRVRVERIKTGPCPSVSVHPNGSARGSSKVVQRRAMRIIVCMLHVDRVNLGQTVRSSTYFSAYISYISLFCFHRPTLRYSVI